MGVSDASGQGSLTISDNKGNTYTQIGTTRTSASGAQIRRYRCENITGGSGHTVTATWGSSSDATVHVLELAGVAAASLDSAASAQTDDNNPPWTVTSGTLAQADSIAIAMTGTAFTGTWSESSGFTVQTQEGNNSLYWTGCAASRVVSATTALTPSFTISGGGSDCAVAIDVFKAAAAGSGITGAGQIASGEASGAPTIAATVAPAGIASAQALGTPGVGASIAAIGIASAEALGTPTVGAVVAPAGVASAQALGAPAVGAAITATGIASGEAVGAPVVNGAGIFAAGIPSGEAFGQPSVGAGIAAAGIGSGEALGQPAVGSGTQPTSSGGGIDPPAWQYRKSKRKKRERDWLDGPEEDIEEVAPAPRMPASPVRIAVEEAVAAARMRSLRAQEVMLIEHAEQRAAAARALAELEEEEELAALLLLL
ncbi:hypothetical protein A8M77_15430 [Variovorax sp. JS1663]|nr:hypothetical protein A8M77_15430 [Variovorax sp. JS1663]